MPQPERVSGWGTSPRLVVVHLPADEPRWPAAWSAFVLVAGPVLAVLAVVETVVVESLDGASPAATELSPAATEAAGSGAP